MGWLKKKAEQFSKEQEKGPLALTVEEVEHYTLRDKRRKELSNWLEEHFEDSPVRARQNGMIADLYIGSIEVATIRFGIRNNEEMRLANKGSGWEVLDEDVLARHVLSVCKKMKLEVR
jgi:hypothetical protein